MQGKQLREYRQELGLSQAKLSELCGVSQYLLSAFELEKSALPSSVLDEVLSALADKEKVQMLVSRTKRYQNHEYSSVDPCERRKMRAARSPGNEAYLAELVQLEGRSDSENGQAKAISLFSGCGGFSLGVSAAGFRVAGFVELDDDLRNIYRLNFQKAKELGSDITKISQSD
jgi:DNA (cytosine-5)-methyltransferase 1